MARGRVIGYRGYVWCTKPSGERYRKYVKGQAYEATQRAWFKLRDEASRGPVSSDVPKLGDFLSYWLKEIVQPNLAPKTYQTYERFVRLHIVPHLGHKRIDQLQVKDIRQWINKLTSICQCCVQGGRRGPATTKTTVLRGQLMLSCDFVSAKPQGRSRYTPRCPHLRSARGDADPSAQPGRDHDGTRRSAPR